MEIRKFLEQFEDAYIFTRIDDNTVACVGIQSGKDYTLCAIPKTASWECSCKGYEFRKKCKHRDMWLGYHTKDQVLIELAKRSAEEIAFYFGLDGLPKHKIASGLESANQLTLTVPELDCDLICIILNVLKNQLIVYIKRRVESAD